MTRRKLTDQPSQAEPVSSITMRPSAPEMSARPLAAGQRQIIDGAMRDDVDLGRGAEAGNERRRRPPGSPNDMKIFNMGLASEQFRCL